MTKTITKKQLEEIEEAYSFDRKEAFELLEKYTGIKGKPYTNWAFYDDADNYIGDSDNYSIRDLLDSAYISVVDEEERMARYTDDEIVRALECCINDDCDRCPNTFGNCEHNAMRNALDLIKRQQAEIEKLNEVKVFNITVSDTKEIMPILFCHEKELKNEAVKEFVKRLKEKASSCVMSYKGQEMPETKSYTISAPCLDELEKEMTEGRK